MSTEAVNLYWANVFRDDGACFWKIGITTGEPINRLKNLGAKGYKLIGSWLMERSLAFRLETEFKNRFAQFKYTGPNFLQSGITELFTKDLSKSFIETIQEAQKNSCQKNVENERIKKVFSELFGWPLDSFNRQEGFCWKLDYAGTWDAFIVLPWEDYPSDCPTHKFLSDRVNKGVIDAMQGNVDCLKTGDSSLLVNWRQLQADMCVFAFPELIQEGVFHDRFRGVIWKNFILWGGEDCAYYYRPTKEVRTLDLCAYISTSVLRGWKCHQDSVSNILSCNASV